MNAFDESILRAVNALVRRSPALDLAVTEVAHAHLLKGGLLVAVLAAVWAAPGEGRTRRRELVVGAGVASLLALGFGRLLAVTLPYRERPIHHPELGLAVPFGDAELVLGGWSAFPSDHAMLFGAMATALFFVSRPLGLAAHAWAAVVIFAPRVYLGFHHPTDIVGGLALGVAFAAAICSRAGRRHVGAPALALGGRHPAWAAALTVVVTVQVASMFADARRLAGGTLAILRVARCERAGQVELERCLEARRPGFAPSAAPAVEPARVAPSVFVPAPELVPVLAAPPEPERVRATSAAGR